MQSNRNISGLNMSTATLAPISNDCGTLCLHKQSTTGKLQDYVITFHKEERDIELVIGQTKDLFLKLIQTFEKKVIMARLVMKIHFQHVNEEVEDRFFHFGSYSTEVVHDPDEFFTRHMYKIAQRLDEFNHHGSNLVIKAISHIHIQLTLLKPMSER